MVLTIVQLLIAVDSGAIARLAAQPIPVAGAWKLRRLARLLDVEYRDARAARLKLFTEENSLPVTGTDARQIRAECVTAFAAEPLFAQTVTIEAEPITEADIQGAAVSVQDLEALGPLVA